MNDLKGLFITIEGMDGSGKSTQLRFLETRLTQAGFPVVFTREPGGCPLSETLREIILSPSQRPTPETELLLYQAARAQHVAEVILPALKAGKIVVCDRFSDSTVAYQGYARGFGAPFTQSLNDFAAQGLHPHLTVFLSLPPQHAFARKGGASPQDRMEQEGADFFAQVYKGFCEIAKKEPGRVKVIETEQNTKYETADIVYNLVCGLLKEKNFPFIPPAVPAPLVQL